MPVTPAASATVRLAFSPDPAYVRTVRLVAAAVARRAGVADEFLDEVRLAIGEACTRAVALHRRYGISDLIDVWMSDGGRFVVRVVDRCANEDQPGSAREIEAARAEPAEIAAQVDAPAGRLAIDEEALTAGVGLALLTGLVSDLVVAAAADGPGTEVRMSWPITRRPAH